MKKYIILVIVDIFFIFVSFILGFYIRFHGFKPVVFFSAYFVPISSLAFIYLACYIFRGTYRTRFKSNFELFELIFENSLLSVVIGMSFTFIFRSKWGFLPSSIFLICFPIQFLLISAVNMLLYKMWGSIYRIVCFMGKKELANVDSLIKREEIDEIVLTTDNISVDKLYFLLNLARYKEAQISILPEIYDKVIAKKIGGEKIEISTLPAYFKNKPEERLIRLCDISLSFCLLFLTLPVILFISLLIRLDSFGRIIYRQERIGRNGKTFILYKFRSMVMEAPLYSRPKEIPLEEDSRVTKIGKIIRKTRLDEFPQLFNVLKGDMSLVGPRPEAIYRVKEHRALQGIRLSVKPGLTGLAQIQGYYHTSPNHKLRYDYLYIRNRSLRFNLNILLKTALVIFLKPGS